jgi:hypothetical protein
MKGWDKESLRHSAAKKFGKAPPYRGKKKIINPILQYPELTEIPSGLRTPEVEAYYELKKEIKDLEDKIESNEIFINWYKPNKIMSKFFSPEKGKQYTKELTKKLNKRKRVLEYLKQQISLQPTKKAKIPTFSWISLI